MITAFPPENASRFVIWGVVAVLALALAFVPGSAGAQTPGPAKPANLTAYPANTEGEIILHWDASKGATHYRVCRRPADGSGRWGCLDSPDNSALLTRLQVGAAYHFAVAAHGEYLHSSWAWTEAVVGIPEAARCPVTGLPLPDGYLSVGQTTTHVSGRTFTLTSITPKGGITQGESDFPPLAGRQYVEVCGKVTAPAGVEKDFAPGSDNNMITDRGVGFRVPDDRVTDWSEVGAVPEGETRSACDVWEVPAGAGTVYYAVNNWLEHPGVYRVELFPDVTNVSANE